MVRITRPVGTVYCLWNRDRSSCRSRRAQVRPPSAPTICRASGGRIARSPACPAETTAFAISPVRRRRVSCKNIPSVFPTSRPHQQAGTCSFGLTFVAIRYPPPCRCNDGRRDLGSWVRAPCSVRFTGKKENRRLKSMAHFVCVTRIEGNRFPSC